MEACGTTGRFVVEAETLIYHQLELLGKRLTKEKQGKEKEELIRNFSLAVEACGSLRKGLS